MPIAVSLDQFVSSWELQAAEWIFLCRSESQNQGFPPAGPFQVCTANPGQFEWGQVCSFSLDPDLLGSHQLSASRPLQIPCQPPLVLPVRTVLLLLSSQAADCWGNRRSVWEAAFLGQPWEEAMGSRPCPSCAGVLSSDDCLRTGASSPCTMALGWHSRQSKAFGSSRAQLP
uniref:Uncharacterized protein n=1 Tax=Myotis myotis TaxID=51298 RepID=A0A7J7TIM3_MYOMY|nr:hypothetical protein mMyoMyo1_009104 [Myotis myotis]